MNEIDGHSLTLLEFHSVKEELKSYCLSVEGPFEIETQRVSVDKAEGLSRLTLAVQFRTLLETNPSFPALDFPALRPILAALSKEGSVLESRELWDIARFLESARTLAAYVETSSPAETGEGSIAALSYRIPDVGDLRKTLKKILNRDGTINESLPALSTIKLKIKKANESIAHLAESYLRNRDLSDCFQSDVPTQKEGRVVLPLKSDYRGKVKGIVHEVSATGKTLFLEPLDIVEKNNHLVDLENSYRREVFRILKETSEEARNNLESLKETVRHILYLDTVYARARFAIHRRCAKAEIREKGICLLQARHPLLGKNAVPLDIVMNDDVKTLVISGPNAGGKTVALKTLGLLALLNQFGMEIPASPASHLPWFSSVFADMGDEQSIANSLSTFSAHVARISYILSNCDEKSLVLLDELGTGTDATEGSALAMAVLDECMSFGAITLATTHQSLLKNYAFARKGVGNASLEFDMENLKPTYKLINGIPGESRAIDIAASSGMPINVIAAAREYLCKKEQDMSFIIKELLALKTDLASKEEALTEKLQELNREKLRNRENERLLKERENKLKREGLGEVNSFLSEARKELENRIREIRENPLTRETIKEAKQFIRDIEEEALSLKDVEAEAPVVLEDADKLEKGMEVYITSTGTRAVLLRKNKDGSWLAAAGAMKLSVMPGDVKIEQKKGKTRPGIAISYAIERSLSEGTGRAPDVCKHTIDLRGMRLEEALKSLRRQIDLAVISGVKEFSVIHGLGEGVLSEGVRDYLKNEKSVRDFFFAHPEEGGFGKTIVLLHC